MHARTVLVMFGIAGCGPAVAVLGTADPVGGVTSKPGTGPGEGAYLVEATARAVGVRTQVTVEVHDADGGPLASVGVAVDDVALSSLDGELFTGELAGYDGDVDLRIDGPSGEFSATAVGPAMHQTTLPAAPLDVAGDVTVTWTPSGATHASIDSDGTGPVALVSDAGSHTFAAGALAVGTEHIGVERWERLELSGAAPGSSFVVAVATLDEVATVEGESTSEDPGAIAGQLRVDSDWQDIVGTAWITLSRDEGASVFQRFDGFQDREDYRIEAVAPGEWSVLAYFDLDASDGESREPSGPTSGDPFVEDTVTVSAGTTAHLDLRMETAL